VLPGPYRDAAGPRAPHVNLSILASGIMARLSTVLFFPGFATANEADPVLRGIPDPALRALLVAAPAEPQEGQRAFRFDILLHGGDEETPFFAE
jgi:protocatechuate 3,4-dioxygenase alpha subunit